MVKVHTQKVGDFESVPFSALGTCLTLAVSVLTDLSKCPFADNAGFGSNRKTKDMSENTLLNTRTVCLYLDAELQTERSGLHS